MSLYGRISKRLRRLGGTTSYLPAGFVGLSIGIGLWEVGARALNSAIVPPFTAVMERLYTLLATGQIIPSLSVSLGNLAAGLAISLVVGITVGAAMGWFRSVDYALSPYVNALLTAPALIFAPIFFALWGVGREPIVALIVAYSIFVVIVNTSVAVQSAPTQMVEMATSYCASRAQVFRYVVVPAALPLVMAGVRLAVGRSVKGMINGEMFIAVVGLGHVIINAGRALDIATVLAVLVVVLLVGLAAMQAVHMLESRVTGWLPSTARS